MSIHPTSTHSWVPIALLGSSHEASRARDACLAAAGDSGPVLIVADEGFSPAETARAIHDRGRAGLPFVAVDASRVKPADVELALFGMRQRPTVGAPERLGASGAFLRAADGTVFIDAISELPFAAQRRLARLLREGEATAAGRSRVSLRARLIASTTSATATDLTDGRIRADLHRRLSAQQIVIPPLRNRPGDFALLVPALAGAVSARLGRGPSSFTQSALNVLAALPWRRNMQELDTLLERILRVVSGDIVKQEDVLAQLSFDGAFARRTPSGSLREARQRFERDYIAAVLEQHDWRMSEAARALGMERANLYRKTRQLGISRAGNGHAVAHR
jgi:two-component system nitrogen regulation response regulator NtrX